ncbi:MAG: nickel-dependent lactate racemase [bacterium]
MEFRFGKKAVNCEVSKENLMGVLEYSRHEVEPLKQILEQSISNPIGKPRLIDLLKKNKPRDVVILVSDITRSIADYSTILGFLVSEIVDAGIDEKNIEFVVALGTHRKHTPEENGILYRDLYSDFRFSFHDCYNDLVSIGKTSTGLDVQVSKRVRTADFVIATGRVNFHYLAGFSGGRKAILPGISSYETIRSNHCKLRRDGVASGRIESNIIAQEMDEAAQLFGVSYLLNVVETPDKQIAGVFCGDAVHAYKTAVEYFKSERISKIAKQADCAIVSAGGYPRDRTFYAGHKAINNAVNAVRQGGSIVLISECEEGIGNPEFEKYMLSNGIDELLDYPEAKIQVGGHRVFKTSQLLKNYKIYVVSKLNSKVLSQMNFIPIKNIDSAIDQVKKNCGQDFKVYIIPDGRSILPVVNGRCK